MSLEREVEISASGIQRVIVDPDMKPEIKMEKQDLKPERHAHLAGHTKVESGGLYPSLQHIKQEDNESSEPQQWEAQWCNFLGPASSLPLGQGLSELPEAVLQHSPKAFPSILEGAEAVSEWAKAEKVPKVTLDSRDFRIPSGGSEEPTENPEAGNSECQRQHFRQFSYREAEGPWETYCQLRKLCHRWLMPERHTKEEMLELVILEQFLAILPLEMLSWIQERDSKSCFHAVALAESFLLRQREKPDQQVRVTLLLEMLGGWGTPPTEVGCWVKDGILAVLDSQVHLVTVQNCNGM
ncbi:PREDICTED: neurotrophin receptor-interacting factor homolog [Thamnophis sirtalis]|uniref:Neurotrophin receptor-interacting factor homolog n=1 Tax=Thamnophis sirtalis TaxID=35019 RepID=A0A6I9YKA4_9SAUR|nr:PREDICTED: neurotrophin receptor-interacting factor homolog [Thamnophis sirtalis]